MPVTKPDPPVFSTRNTEKYKMEHSDEKLPLLTPTLCLSRNYNFNFRYFPHSPKNVWRMNAAECWNVFWSPRQNILDEYCTERHWLHWLHFSKLDLLRKVFQSFSDNKSSYIEGKVDGRGVIKLQEQGKMLFHYVMFFCYSVYSQILSTDNWLFMIG